MESRNTDVRDLLENWGNRTVVAIDAHYYCSRFYSKRHYWLGIPAILLSAIVGSSIFAMTQSQAKYDAAILLGLLSVVSAVLSSLQTFFRFSERAELHKATASKYSAVKREIELLLTNPSLNYADTERELNTLRHRLDDLSSSSPKIPEGVWEKTRVKHKRPTVGHG